MQALNKKAVSELVTTSILVSLAIASTALAFYSVTSVLKLSDLQSSPTFNCLEFTTQFPPIMKIVSACINSENKVQVIIQRNQANVKIPSLSFTLGNEVWECSDNCPDCKIPAIGNSKIYYLAPEQNPLGKTLEVFIEGCFIDKTVIKSC